MRIYTTVLLQEIRTVKAQGLRIAQAWLDQYGQEVAVKAIKRTQLLSTDQQRGFVVLESLFSTYLCHYELDGVRLTVTPEKLLNADHRSYLKCPVNLLAQAEPTNSYWRDCVQAYCAATKELTKDRLAGNVTLFLKKCFDTRQYSEPFFILQKTDGQWFGVDCYGDRKPLSIGIDDIHDHCPLLVDDASLRPMESCDLADDCVIAAGLIYKVSNSRGVLLGRCMTRAEIVRDRIRFVMPVKFDLHEGIAWA